MNVFPELAAPVAALRHALLNLLSVAIPRAQGGTVYVSARLSKGEFELDVKCSESAARPASAPSGEKASLDMARRLASLCGGRLVLSDAPRTFAATLVLPAPEQVQVLVVDDNADTLQLLQRYAAGTRYRIIGTREPAQALDLAEKLSPQIIVLDVMMPEMDGWEVLGQLRQHPATRQASIVVCTILPQELLALSLGANAFLRKPFTQLEFLQVLDQQVEWLNVDLRSNETTTQ